MTDVGDLLWMLLKLYLTYWCWKWNLKDSQYKKVKNQPCLQKLLRIILNVILQMKLMTNLAIARVLEFFLLEYYYFLLIYINKVKYKYIIM